MFFEILLNGIKRDVCNTKVKFRFLLMNLIDNPLKPVWVLGVLVTV